jgi:hypothetical protein
MNAWKGGHRQEWRELSKMLNAELRNAKQRQANSWHSPKKNSAMICGKCPE